MDAMARADETSVLRLTRRQSEFVAAAKALSAILPDFQPEHAKWLIDKKKPGSCGRRLISNSNLDKLNVEICLANRVALAPYLDPKRFHWFSLWHSFLFPLRQSRQANRDGECVYVPLQEKVLQRYKAQEKIDGFARRPRGYERSAADSR